MGADSQWRRLEEGRRRKGAEEREGGEESEVGRPPLRVADDVMRGGPGTEELNGSVRQGGNESEAAGAEGLEKGGAGGRVRDDVRMNLAGRQEREKAERDEEGSIGGGNGSGEQQVAGLESTDDQSLRVRGDAGGEDGVGRGKSRGEEGEVGWTGRGEGREKGEGEERERRDEL